MDEVARTDNGDENIETLILNDEGREMRDIVVYFHLVIHSPHGR